MKLLIQAAVDVFNLNSFLSFFVKELIPELERAATGNVHHHLTKLLKDNRVGK